MLVVFEPYDVPDEEGSKVLKGTQSQSSLRPVSEEAAMPKASCGRDDVTLAFRHFNTFGPHCTHCTPLTHHPNSLCKHVCNRCRFAIAGR